MQQKYHFLQRLHFLVKLYSVKRHQDTKSYFFELEYTLLFNENCFNLQSSLEEECEGSNKDCVNAWPNTWSDLDCHWTYMKLRKCCTKEEFMKVAGKFYKLMFGERPVGPWLYVQKMMREESNLSIVANRLVSEKHIDVTLEELMDKIDSYLHIMDVPDILSKLPEGMTEATQEQILSDEILIDDTVSLKFIALCFRDMAIKVPLGAWSQCNVLKANTCIIAPSCITVLSFDEFCSNKEYLCVMPRSGKSLIKVPITTRVKLDSLDLYTYALVMSRFRPDIDFNTHLREQFKRITLSIEASSVNIQLVNSRKCYLSVLSDYWKTYHKMYPLVNTDSLVVDNLRKLIDEL